MENYTAPRIIDYNGELAKRWFIQYSYRDPDTAKMIGFRKWVSSSHKTKTARYVAAKQLRDELDKKLREGFNPFLPHDVRKGIAQALDKIISLKEITLRKRTAHSYRSVAHLFCAWMDKNKFTGYMPHQLTRHICNAYFDDCLLIEKISPRTYNNRLRTLRTLFNELVLRDYIDYNVFQKIKLLPEIEPRLNAYTREEKQTIKETISEAFPCLWLAAMFVYYTFVRPQELMRLKIAAIDFDNSLLHINGNQSKNKRMASVLIPAPLMDLLKAMNYHTLPKDLFIFSNGKKLTPGIKEISPNRLFNAWQQYVIKPTGINKGIYLFKHTGAGELFDLNADPRNIQLQLRHSSLEETVVYLEKYSNRPNDNLRGFFRDI